MNINALTAYLNERFPPINMALFAVLFGTVYSVAGYFWPAFNPLGFGWREGLGMVAVISFFFRLRVFDEIKDYDLDSVNHPQRVLQSGRVTLGQLGKLAMAGGVTELLWSGLMGVPALVCWGLAVGYSLLMRYEFFMSRYLSKRLVLYALTHMLVMPLVIGWIWSAYVPNYGLSRPLFLLAALSLLGGFSFEIARKLHTPAAERELVDSYSKSIGYGPAIFTVLVILLSSVAVQCYLLLMLRSGLLPVWVIGGLYVFTLLLYLYALVGPAEKILRLAEVMVSLFMVVGYLSIILVINGG